LTIFSYFRRCPTEAELYAGQIFLAIFLRISIIFSLIYF